MKLLNLIVTELTSNKNISFLEAKKSISIHLYSICFYLLFLVPRQNKKNMTVDSRGNTADGCDQSALPHTNQTPI